MIQPHPSGPIDPTFRANIRMTVLEWVGADADECSSERDKYLAGVLNHECQHVQHVRDELQALETTVLFAPQEVCKKNKAAAVNALKRKISAELDAEMAKATLKVECEKAGTIDPGPQKIE